MTRPLITDDNLQLLAKNITKVSLTESFETANGIKEAGRSRRPHLEINGPRDTGGPEGDAREVGRTFVAESGNWINLEKRIDGDSSEPKYRIRYDYEHGSAWIDMKSGHGARCLLMLYALGASEFQIDQAKRLWRTPNELRYIPDHDGPVKGALRNARHSFKEVVLRQPVYELPDERDPSARVLRDYFDGLENQLRGYVKPAIQRIVAQEQKLKQERDSRPKMGRDNPDYPDAGYLGYERPTY
jgi:hypothetical protein